jgi:hypothetical protein
VEVAGWFALAFIVGLYLIAWRTDTQFTRRKNKVRND